MRFSVPNAISRAAYLLGLLGAAFAQTGCAHPVMVEPSVVIHSRIGHPQVYAHPAPSVVYYPQVMVRPAPMYAPQMMPIYKPPSIQQHHGHALPRPVWGGHGRVAPSVHNGRDAVRGAGRGVWGQRR